MEGHRILITFRFFIWKYYYRLYEADRYINNGQESTRLIIQDKLDVEFTSFKGWKCS